MKRPGSQAASGGEGVGCRTGAIGPLAARLQGGDASALGRTWAEVGLSPILLFHTHKQCVAPAHAPGATAANLKIPSPLAPSSLHTNSASPWRTRPVSRRKNQYSKLSSPLFPLTINTQCVAPAHAPGVAAEKSII